MDVILEPANHVFKKYFLHFSNRFLCKVLATHSWESHEIVYFTQKHIQVRSNLREFIQNRTRSVHPLKMMDERTQLTISTTWLVNRILATVIISVLSRFCVWQSSAVFISCKTHSLIIYVFCPTSVWLVSNKRIPH